VGTNAFLSGQTGEVEDVELNFGDLVYRFAGKKGEGKWAQVGNINAVVYSSAYITNENDNFVREELETLNGGNIDLLVHAGAHLGSFNADSDADGLCQIDVRDDVTAYRFEFQCAQGIVSVGNNVATLLHIDEGTNENRDARFSFTARFADIDVKERSRVQFGRNVQMQNVHVSGSKVDFVAGSDFSFWLYDIECADETERSTDVTDPCTVVMHSGAQGSHVWLEGNTISVFSGAHIDTLVNHDGDFSPADQQQEAFEHYLLCGTEVGSVIADDGFEVMRAYLAPTTKVHHAAYGTFNVRYLNEGSVSGGIDNGASPGGDDVAFVGLEQVTTACCRQGYAPCDTTKVEDWCGASQFAGYLGDGNPIDK
jgi:hypothetical protein